ncbi:MAG TPA: hypothetical protein VFW44_04245 [Bryobacteraceae bacterium]|nr:hypothetical protein [Bryobacteraceae bacterium]
MKIFAKVLLGVGLLLGTGVCAMADIVWMVNDVFFTFHSEQNELTGSFTTDDAVTHVESFNLTVTGDLTSGLFTAALMVDSYLPNTIGIADASFSDYIDLYGRCRGAGTSHASGVRRRRGPRICCDAPQTGSRELVSEHGFFPSLAFADALVGTMSATMRVS